MAPIYKPESSGSVPNYLGYSHVPIADKSQGITLSAIGDVFDSAVSSADTIIKQDIQQTAYNSTSDIVNQNIGELKSGLTEKFTPPNSPDSTTPPEITSTVKSLQTAKDQKLAGKLNQTMFDMRIDAAASDLRAKYPGYKDIIDQTFSSIRGSSTANQVRRDLQNILQSHSETADAWVKEIHGDAKYLADPEMFKQALAANGDPQKMTAIRSYIAGQKILEHKQAIDKADMETKAAQNKLNSENAVRYSTDVASDTFKSVYSKFKFVGTQMGKTTFADAISSINEETIKDPVKQTQLGAAIDNLAAQYQTAVNPKLYDRTIKDKDGNLHSIASFIADNDKTKKIIDGPIEYLKDMKKSLLGGDWTSFQSTAKIFDALQGEDALRIYSQQKDGIRILGGWKKILGPELAGALKDDPRLREGMGEVISSVRDIKLREFVVDGKSNFFEAKHDADTVKPTQTPADEKSKSLYLKDLMDKTDQILTNPATPPEVKKNLSKVKADVQNALLIDKYPQDQRFSVIANIANPKAIKTIKETDPTSFRSFLQWTTSSIYNNMRDYSSTIKEEMKHNPNIKLDPTTFQFNVTTAPQATGTQTALSRTIAQANTGLATYKNLLEASGQDVPSNMAKMLDLLGVKVPETGDTSKTPTNGRTEVLPPQATQTAQNENNAPAASPEAPGAIPAGQTLSYEDWKTQNNLSESNDYNLRAAYNAGLQPDPNTHHLSDQYKLPNHITFSDGSIYNNNGTGGAGHWEDLGNGKWSFTPGPTNLKYHTPQELKDYFNKYEKGNTLILPKSENNLPVEFAKLNKEEKVSALGYAPKDSSGMLDFNVTIPVKGVGNIETKGMSPQNAMRLATSPAVTPKTTLAAYTDQSERLENVRGYGQQLTGKITINGHEYQFINGGGGRGSIPFGTYKVSNFRDAATREKQGLNNLGDTFDLSPKYDPLAEDVRSDLRIHRAHGHGTLGCIGIVGSEETFQQFVKDVKASGIKSLYLGPPPKTQKANDNSPTDISSQSRQPQDRSSLYTQKQIDAMWDRSQYPSSRNPMWESPKETKQNLDEMLNKSQETIESDFKKLKAMETPNFHVGKQPFTAGIVTIPKRAVNTPGAQEYLKNLPPDVEVIHHKNGNIILRKIGDHSPSPVSLNEGGLTDISSQSRTPGFSGLPHSPGGEPNPLDPVEMSRMEREARQRAEENLKRRRMETQKGELFK